MRASLASRKSSPSGESGVSIPNSPHEGRSFLGASAGSSLLGGSARSSSDARPSADRVRRTQEPTVSSVGFSCSPSLTESPATPVGGEALFKSSRPGVRSGLLRRELSGDVDGMCLETNDGAQLLIQPAVARRKSQVPSNSIIWWCRDTSVLRAAWIASAGRMIAYMSPPNPSSRAQRFEDLPTPLRPSPTAPTAPTVESLLAEAVVRSIRLATRSLRCLPWRGASFRAKF